MICCCTASALDARALSRPRRRDVTRRGDGDRPRTPDPFANRSRRAAELEHAREKARQWNLERREIEDVWRRIPTERRESMLLQLLAAERLTISELTSRLNVQLLGVEGKGPHGKHAAVYHSNVRALVMRMQRAGRLERTPETFRNKIRYRYGAASA
jgi:hypothetical protein